MGLGHDLAGCSPILGAGGEAQARRSPIPRGQGTPPFPNSGGVRCSPPSWEEGRCFPRDRGWAGAEGLSPISIRFTCFVKLMKSSVVVAPERQSLGVCSKAPVSRLPQPGPRPELWPAAAQHGAQWEQPGSVPLPGPVQVAIAW